MIPTVRRSFCHVLLVIVLCQYLADIGTLFPEVKMQQLQLKQGLGNSIIIIICYSAVIGPCNGLGSQQIQQKFITGVTGAMNTALYSAHAQSI